ncbi:recombinase family protein [Micromonospora tulbaghiae]|uniref:recombinase family protein n=1 Tax=Micromonospora tulbaghiae TaxID=479978 RepID=UPI0033EC90A9
MPRRPLLAAQAAATKPVRAVLYLRQSITRVKRDAQGNKTTELDTISPEIQEHAGREYCARRGYHVVAVVTDLNRTGRTLARRKVQETIGYIERGEAEVIVLWKWSRLARNRRDFAVTCDYVEAKFGGRIESSTEPADTTTATGRLNRGILAEFAAFESDRVGEIIKEVHDNRARQGLPGSGRTRFGYRTVDKRFVVDPTTGPVLREAYLRYIGGAGFTAITRWLNDHGHQTTYGKPFRYQAVQLMLDSGFGAGYFTHRGELLRGIHEPVITAREWNAYLAAREGRSVMPSRAKASPHLLVGLVKCGKCLTALTARPDRQGHMWYRCKSRSERGCDNSMVRIADVEAAVYAWLEKFVGDIDAAVRTARAQQERWDVAEGQAKTLRQRIGEQDKALTRLTVDRARNLVPEDAYLMARDEIQATRDRLAGELEQVERQVQPIRRVDPSEYKGLLAEWPTIPVQARRDALRKLISRVRVWSPPLRVEVDDTWSGSAL